MKSLEVVQDKIMNPCTKLFGSFPERFCVQRNLLYRGSRNVFHLGVGGCKWPSYESDDTSPFSVEVKNGWIYTSTLPHTLIAITETVTFSLPSPQCRPTSSVRTPVSVTVLSCVPQIKTVSHENWCENRRVTEIRARKFSAISSKTKEGTETYGEGEMENTDNVYFGAW